MSKTTNKFSSEVRERAVRMVLDNCGEHESRWGAIVSISSKIGCAAQTLLGYAQDKASGMVSDKAAGYFDEAIRDWVKGAVTRGGKVLGGTAH